MERKKTKRAYLVGIKGIAMTGLAVYLKEKGYFVAGSDVRDTFPTDEILNKYSIPVLKGFHPGNLGDFKFDFVVVTGAHGGLTNIEAQAAIEHKLHVFMHGKFIGKLMEGFF